MIPSPPPLLAVLNRRVANGVWTIDELPEGAIADLTAHGWVSIALELDESMDKSALLHALGDAGDFPDHYGVNWDAAADLLADLSWLAAGDDQPPVAIVIDRAERWAAGHEHDAAILIDVLDEAAVWWSVRGRPFVVLWHGRRAPIPCLDQV